MQKLEKPGFEPPISVQILQLHLYLAVPTVPKYLNLVYLQVHALESAIKFSRRRRWYRYSISASPPFKFDS